MYKVVAFRQVLLNEYESWMNEWINQSINQSINEFAIFCSFVHTCMVHCVLIEVASTNKRILDLIFLNHLFTALWYASAISSSWYPVGLTSIPQKQKKQKHANAMTILSFCRCITLLNCVKTARRIISFSPSASQSLYISYNKHCGKITTRFHCSHCCTLCLCTCF